MEEEGDIDRDIVRTPLERELNKARVDLARYEQDMRAVGITEEQIEGTIAKAQERIRKEFEERKRQDPLEIVENALREASQTEDERLIAGAWCRDIDYGRARLMRYAKNPQELEREDPTYRDWRRDEGT